MYAVGHFALGYLTGKVTAKALNVNINLPLIFIISVFPDIDILIPGLYHRGPLHSILAYFLLFLPVFLLYRKKAAPYFVALLQHSIIGDYLTGGTQLLWPISNEMYGLNIDVTSLTNIIVEWFFFLISIAVMFKTKDVLSLFKHQTSNLILTIPVFTVLLPTVISFPLFVPFALLIPHLVFLTLFGLSILLDWKEILTKT
jgi:membrane-bound metal-dependent hydrolase YbcI (DUF457 family)